MSSGPNVPFSHVPPIPRFSGWGAPECRLFRFVSDRRARGRWVELDTQTHEGISRDRSIPIVDLEKGMFIRFGSRARVARPLMIVDYSLTDAHASGLTWVTEKSMTRELLDFAIGRTDQETARPAITATAKWNLWRYSIGAEQWSDVSDRVVRGLSVDSGDTLFAGWRDGGQVYPMVAAQFPGTLGGTTVTEDVPSPFGATLRQLIIQTRGWTVPFQPGDALRTQFSTHVTEEQWRNDYQVLDMLCMAATGHPRWEDLFEAHVGSVLIDHPLGSWTDEDKKIVKRTVGDRKRGEKLRSVIGRAMSTTAGSAAGRYAESRPIELTAHPVFTSGPDRADHSHWSTFFETPIRDVLRYYTGFTESAVLDPLTEHEKKTLQGGPDRVTTLALALKDASVFTSSDIVKMTQYMNVLEEVQTWTF